MEKTDSRGALGTPEEFASVVAFLASERAGYVNGVSLTVDGGTTRSLLWLALFELCIPDQVFY